MSLRYSDFEDPAAMAVLRIEAALEQAYPVQAKALGNRAASAILAGLKSRSSRDLSHTSAVKLEGGRGGTSALDIHVPPWHIVTMNLDQWMEKTGTTNTALADRLGVSQPFVSRLRSGTRQPSLTIAHKLAKITKLPTSAFLTEAA